MYLKCKYNREKVNVWNKYLNLIEYSEDVYIQKEKCEYVLDFRKSWERNILKIPFLSSTLIFHVICITFLTLLKS